MLSRLDLSHGGIVRIATMLIAVSMALYHMWAIAFGTPEAIIFRGTHLIFALTLVFLVYRRLTVNDGTPPTLPDYALIAAGTVPVLYLFFNYDYLINRIFYIDELTTADMVLGTILIAVVLEATRRVVGWALPATALIFLAYGLFVARPARRHIHAGLHADGGAHVAQVVGPHLRLADGALAQRRLPVGSRAHHHLAQLEYLLALLRAGCCNSQYTERTDHKNPCPPPGQGAMVPA